jgi:Yip1 domain
MSHLINIFLEPGKVFAELKEKPTFLLPALLAGVLTALAATLYFLNVDADWFANQQLQAMAGDMSKAELEQVSKMMPGARTMAWFTAPMVLLTVTISYVVFAFYYWLAGKVTGNPMGYRQGLALVAWSSMPMVIGAVVALIAVYTSSPQSTFESMQLLSIDPLFVQLPMDHDWSRLAKSFSLLNLWVWFLGALGWKTWFRTGWGQALSVVLLPSILIYGGMALFALL